MSTKNLWTFASRRTGYERTTPLHLFYEVNLSSISYDYDDMPASEMFNTWLRQVRDSEGRGGEPVSDVSIYWAVATEDWKEWAPFKRSEHNRSFLDGFTWPIHAETGERVRWASLPVTDKRHDQFRRQTDGFIKAYTGWKPSPLQPTVDVAMLLASVGRLSEAQQLMTEPLAGLN